MLQEAKKVQLLYTPSKAKPMHIVVFGSGSGTNLEALLKAQYQMSSSSDSTPLYEVKALFTDRKCRFQEIGASAGIPVIYHSFANFMKATGISNPNDAAFRNGYDAENLRLLLVEANQSGFSIDLILLAGYMRLIYPPLLQHFPNKILNIHPADLTRLSPDGSRRYVGAHAVRDALCAGESRTRSSVILVDEQVDAGPILVSGPWVNYQEGYPITEERIKKHQEKQKVLSDWPSCIAAINFVAQGRVGLDDENNVYVDGICQERCGLEN